MSSAARAGGFAGPPQGYAEKVIRSTQSELRIPADPAYVIVAKRAAAGFGYVAGFGVEAVDELCIAIAQACENAIRCVRSSSAGPGQIRIAFKLEGQRLDVQVRSSCSRADEEGAHSVVPQGESRAARAAARVQADREYEQARVHDLALRMMGLFVDDCRYRVDERTGGLRVRLTKYRVS